MPTLGTQNASSRGRPGSPWVDGLDDISDNLYISTTLSYFTAQVLDPKEMVDKLRTAVFAQIRLPDFYVEACEATKARKRSIALEAYQKKRQEGHSDRDGTITAPPLCGPEEAVKPDTEQ